MPFQTLVTVGDLAAHLCDPEWIIFDCRHDLAHARKGERAYREAHIPGARFAHLDRDLAGAKTGTNGRHPLPDPVTFADWLGRAGVSGEKQVIAYDDAGGAFAARLWWLLLWMGHTAAAVLDGGWNAWLNAGRTTTDAILLARPARFDGRPDHSMTVDAATLQAGLESGALRIIDARSPDRYRGENETIDPVAGHIPGAVNRFFKENLEAGGRFRSAEELRAALEPLAAGRRGAQLVNQCGSGITACHNLLALEIAGLPGARLYPGSWSEWCSDPRRPIARD